MATVKKATIELFDKIYPLLQHFAIKELTKDEWRQLLGCRWSTIYDHFGYVLLDGDKVVGFLGTFFHERQIAGKKHSICNLFCWYVLEEYRRESLLLILAVLNLQNTTVTSLTPSREAGLVLERFKFTPLECSLKIFTFFSAFAGSAKAVLSTDSAFISSRLDPHDLVVFRDHALPNCRHLICTDPDDEKSYCYLVFNKIRKKKISFTQIYYVSNPRLLRKWFPRIQRFFCKTNHTLFSVIDKRLVKNNCPAGGFDYTLRYPRLFRSADLAPARLDNLYTELLFLKKV
jgi:hypothetical protein